MADASAHGYTFNVETIKGVEQEIEGENKFRQVVKCVCRWKLIAALFKETPEGLDNFLVRDGGVKG